MGWFSVKFFYSGSHVRGYIMDVLPVSPGSGEGMPDRTTG